MGCVGEVHPYVSGMGMGAVDTAAGLEPVDASTAPIPIPLTLYVLSFLHHMNRRKK